MEKRICHQMIFWLPLVFGEAFADMTLEKTPFEDVFPSEIVIFQPAILVYWRVTMSFCRYIPVDLHNVFWSKMPT